MDAERRAGIDVAERATHKRDGTSADALVVSWNLHRHTVAAKRACEANTGVYVAPTGKQPDLVEGLRRPKQILNCFKRAAVATVPRNGGKSTGQIAVMPHSS